MGRGVNGDDPFLSNNVVGVHDHNEATGAYQHDDWETHQGEGYVGSNTWSQTYSNGGTAGVFESNGTSTWSDERWVETTTGTSDGQVTGPVRTESGAGDGTTETPYPTFIKSYEAVTGNWTFTLPRGGYYEDWVTVTPAETAGTSNSTSGTPEGEGGGMEPQMGGGEEGTQPTSPPVNQPPKITISGEEAAAILASASPNAMKDYLFQLEGHKPPVVYFDNTPAEPITEQVPAETTANLYLRYTIALATALEEAKLQWLANAANGVQDKLIDIADAGLHMNPLLEVVGVPHLRRSDWSKDLVFREPDWVHDTSKWLSAEGLFLVFGGVFARNPAGPQSPAVAGKITGYTRHGLNQAIGRDGGIGVAPRAILDAIKNPVRVVQQTGGKTRYVGRDATVVLNEGGQVITTWPNGSQGLRHVVGGQ